VADRIQALGRRRVRVAIDGRTAAGKTTLGHELARLVAGTGRVVLRASLDDFKRPWSERGLYDRTSGDGYYRNAFDLDVIRRLLLEPSGPDGSGLVALCSIDPITQVDHADARVAMPDDGVLIVDGVFTLRPELRRHWDLSIWVDIGANLSVRRGVLRDAARVGAEAAEVLHRDRYSASEAIYLAEVDAVSLADVRIDNVDFDRPRIVRG
jgi:uridine kinase